MEGLDSFHGEGSRKDHMTSKGWNNVLINVTSRKDRRGDRRDEVGFVERSGVDRTRDYGNGLR